MTRANGRSPKVARVRRPRSAASRGIDLADLQARRAGSVPRMLFNAYNVCRDYVLAELAGRGYPDVNMSHAVLLRQIDFQGTSLAELARRAGVSRQAMTKLARQLERLRYVRVQSDAGDRRIRVVRLTAHGLAMAAACIQAYEALERRFERVVGRGRLTTLRVAIRRICESDITPRIQERT
ncbi:MAG: hypothetical protein CHACPFDD_00595 [Phycisphaerae bacterium]|nr:hypothetical protein [Phycisphaerae bacterium]